MLDLKYVRENKQSVIDAIRAKKCQVDIDSILSFDEERRSLIEKAEKLKGERNKSSEEIGALIASKKDVTSLKARVKAMGDDIKGLDQKINGLESVILEKSLYIPNIPHASTPPGRSPEDNEIVRDWGKKPEFSFAPKAHWDLGGGRKIFRRNNAIHVKGYLLDSTWSHL